MTGPSPHLSWAELACKDGTVYPMVWRQSRAMPLSEVFETIRAACGNKPITVTSAYRTPEHNRRIGGARNSQHVQGRALDLKPPKGMPVGIFYGRIRQLIDEGHLPTVGGIGFYKRHGFVHVDIRPGDRLAVWSGTGAKDDRA